MSEPCVRLQSPVVSFLDVLLPNLFFYVVYPAITFVFYATAGYCLVCVLYRKAGEVPPLPSLFGPLCIIFPAIFFIFMS
jgi:hypothetical protein